MMRGIHLVAPVSFLPSRVLTLSELSIIERFQKDAEMLRNDVGYQQIYLAGETEDHVDLAIAAGKKCLDASGAKPEQITAVLMCSHFKSGSWERIGQLRVHAELGLAPECSVTDIATGNCTGLLRTLALAHAMVLSSDRPQRILVLASDRLDQRFVRRRVGSRIFGDGASAMLITSSEDSFFAPKLKMTHLPATWVIPSFLDISRLNGDTAVEAAMLRAFKIGAEKVATNTMESASLRPTDLCLIATTNYGPRFWHSMFDKLALPMELIYRETLPKVGHVATSDVLYNVLSADRDGLVIKGKKILLISTGIGIACEAMTLEVV
jgi:3-oxoacyl-[acyl-carrier-protein] synthase-3